MDDMIKIYTIILANGAKIENLRLNGNNFVSSVEVTREMFEGNTVPVTISDGESEEHHDFMELVQITQDSETGDYMFILRDVPESELYLQKLNSNIQYLSMMTGVELF